MYIISILKKSGDNFLKVLCCPLFIEASILIQNLKFIKHRVKINV